MFSKWFIFIVLLAFAENSPATSPEEHDITNVLNGLISDIIQSFEWNSVYVHVSNNTDNNYTSTVHDYDVAFQNGIQFSNITSKFQASPTLKIQLIFYEPITAICEMMSVSMKGYLKNSNHYIATEVIPFNFTLRLPKLQSKDDGKKPVIVDYYNFDQYNIKLLTNGYQFKLNEEEQIKQDFKTYLKTTLKEKVNQDWKVSLIFLGYTFLRGLGQKTTIVSSHDDFLQNEQNHYYWVGTIPSADYTLSNVTIKGLWNFRSILLDFSNPVAFPELQISDVSGTMLQKFPSTVEKSVELSFKADTIYVSADQRAAKINIKAEAYSVKNTKADRLLTNEQSKVIVERVESAIGAVLRRSMKDFLGNKIV